ncbi:hypothetical protein, partial [Microvirga aerilata]
MRCLLPDHRNGPTRNSRQFRFSAFFKLKKKQAELDFIDIDTSQDMRLFIDPYAIEMRDDELSAELAHHITTFFEDVLTSLRKKDRVRAKFLTSNLGEPQETFLGMSKGKPQGRGMGRFDADQLLRALEASKAFKTGLITDLAEAELFIDGIGPDKISDLTTNLIRAPLIKYTHEQCDLHNVPLTKHVPIAPVWDPDTRDWRSEYQDLPVVAGIPVILVPKVLVRLKLSLNSQEYYNGTVLNFLKSEHLASNSGLVRLLKNKSRKVFKKDLKQKHPFSKEFLTEVTQKNPRLLEFYKELKGARGALENEDLERDYSETDFASMLSEKLKAIKSGSKHATEYHTAIAGILTFLFYPELVYPVLEEGLHGGRKRIDLTFTNWSNNGFFANAKVFASNPSKIYYCRM